MEEALRAARRALDAGEVPVGAIVVCGGEIIGRGWNRNLTDSDPTAHAEIIALREAGANLGNHRMGDCELFATIEPCPMCAGALVHARIKRLVYGADDPKAGAVHSVMTVLNHPQLNHRMEVRGGVLAGRCAELLQSFFRSRREGRLSNQIAKERLKPRPAKVSLGSSLHCVLRRPYPGLEWPYAAAPPPRNRPGLPDVDCLLVRDCAAHGAAI